MKSATLSYHRDFPWTPVSGWAGARRIGWVSQTGPNGKSNRSRAVTHPFVAQRKGWCLLSVGFDGVHLDFAFPQELDLVMDVLAQNPLPLGRALVPQVRIGRPNNHWLSRLPVRAKPYKFRKRLCGYLEKARQVKRFRAFYARSPSKVTFPGTFDTEQQARYTV